MLTTAFTRIGVPLPLHTTCDAERSAKKTSMQCNFCYKEITEGGYVWLNKQWCGISHVEPHVGAGLPHICDKCTNSLSKKEIIQ